jgi:PAT family beta-lactamase induction signal transducer AmpG
VRWLWVVAVVYLIEGYPAGIFADVIPVWLRLEGASLATIGAVSGLRVAWSAKALWSPLVQRYGDHRAWIAGSMLTVAACLLLLARAGGEGRDATLWALIALLCVASATQDIAIDAYTIGIVPRGREGPANGVRINAYRIAVLVAGAGLLLLPERVGWSATFGAAALLAIALSAPLARCPAVELPPAARREFVHALRVWITRPGAPSVFAFVLLYRLGDLAMGPMVKPFWVDRALTLDEIALVSTTLGTVATLLGAALGGLAVARLGIGRALYALGALALISNLGYAAAAAFPGSGRAGIYAASIAESFSAGLAAAGFLAYLMRICEPVYAAVQYALLTGGYLLPGTVLGSLSGRAVELLGYAPFFALTALAALPAFLFLPGARRWLAGPGA